MMKQQGRMQNGCAKASKLFKHPIIQQGENDACVAQAISIELGLFKVVSLTDPIIKTIRQIIVYFYLRCTNKKCNIKFTVLIIQFHQK